MEEKQWFAHLLALHPSSSTIDQVRSLLEIFLPISSYHRDLPCPKKP